MNQNLHTIENVKPTVGFFLVLCGWQIIISTPYNHIMLLTTKSILEVIDYFWNDLGI